jgi:hypothetical protein
VKKEDHTAQLVVTLICELVAMLYCFPFWLNVNYEYGVPPLETQLLADFLFGLSLLPVIAALRRGKPGHKVAAITLAILPTMYVSIVVPNKYPGFVAEFLSE